MDIQPVRSLLILPALLLAACAPDLSQDDARRKAIETLVADPSMRGEVVDRLLKTEADRSAVFQKIVGNDPMAEALVQQLLQSERGQALMASQIAADRRLTREFMRKLMLTGAVGEILTQEQAEQLRLGDSFAHGNQLRTMADLKRLGAVVDRWAREKKGSYPVCESDDDVSACLASLLPDHALDDLRLDDAWGRPFQYHSDEGGKGYALISYATDGMYDRLGRVGPTSSYDSDIVFSNGEFVQWPGQIRKDSIR